ncbi:MAG TPA: dynamin family protein [Nostocaceae cyanobacterium]|nr:dynamin family protein [Nostocaceae cyanobacterium]
MSSEQFQAAHSSIYNLGTRLLQYLQEIRQSRLSEGDDTKSLETVENDINRALTALKEQKYQVAVIAAMKAGKSTFLNSIIGADVLASETEACTVCRTDIRPIDNHATSKLLEYRQGTRKPIEIAQGNSEEIRTKFIERTHEIRSKANTDQVIRFELQHPIEAISNLSSLTGFTLVDTPGPNEWESANFSTVALKQTALEALRTCDAILFILDYSSFKDNTNAELLQDLIEQRKEFLAQNTGKIYFILNKVDRKAEKDRSIKDVMADLKQALIGFGIPDPIIYPASAWQGLLAKLIKSKVATKEHKSDFKNFFLARYIEEDEDGDPFVPKLSEIAPKALTDSGIPRIETSVIQAVVQNSGWNFLSDVLAKIDKAAKSIEDTLNTKISGWEMDIKVLKQKVEEYKKRSQNAKIKVENVKKSVDRQKQILVRGFTQGIDIFASRTKIELQNQIDQIAESKIGKSSGTKKSKYPSTRQTQTNNDIDWGEIIADFGGGIIDIFSKSVGKIFRISVKGGESLFKALSQSVPEVFNDSDLSVSENQTNADPYIIRVKTNQDAQNISKTINEFCAPLIQSFWLDTQDKLVRDGTTIRQELALKIQNDIQQISDELSNYLEEALQVELNVNPIQFPSFEFSGIDAKIRQQQEIFRRMKKEERIEKNCCNTKIYYVPVEYEDKQDFYEIDLHQTLQLINLKIDEQVARNREALEGVIEKQIADDFRKAEQQINDYIKKFQNDFDNLLKERETKQAEADQILTALNFQKAKLNEYLQELKSIQQSLDTWKPV